MNTRAEHLQWCKKRAQAYIDVGDANTAWISFVSDLGKHPETCGHSAVSLGMMMIETGHLETPEAMGKFIQGFN